MTREHHNWLGFQLNVCLTKNSRGPVYPFYCLLNPELDTKIPMLMLHQHFQQMRHEGGDCWKDTVTSWVTITQGALSWNGLQNHTRDQSSMSAGCLGISFPLNSVLLLSCFLKIICCFRFKVYLCSGQYKHRGFQLYSPERKMRQCSHTQLISSLE